MRSTFRIFNGPIMSYRTSWCAGIGLLLGGVVLIVMHATGPVDSVLDRSEADIRKAAEESVRNEYLGSIPDLGERTSEESRLVAGSPMPADWRARVEAAVEGWRKRDSELRSARVSPTISDRYGVASAGLLGVRWALRAWLATGLILLVLGLALLAHLFTSARSWVLDSPPMP